MNLTFKPFLRCLATLLLAGSLAMPASAGLICKDSPAGRGAVDCDNSFRNMQLNCKSGTIDPPCYKTNSVPMKDTKKQTFKDVSDYLYIYARDPNDKTRPYSGDATRGALASPSEILAPIGEAPPGLAKQKACVNQIDLKADSTEDQKKLARLQLDNCANQYILQATIAPYHKEASPLLCPTKDNPSKRCGQADLCQPLRMMPPDNEYLASDYITAAWKKLLQDSKYRLNKDAKDEPHLPDGIDIKNKITIPTELGEIKLSQIAAAEYEEIVDPSHPFSPRWDYAYNERDKYSPMTKKYTNDDKNSVFCAGDKDKHIYKVDILSFREKSLKFDKKVTDRITFNDNCFANKKQQASACCKLKIPSIAGIPVDPNPAHWTCEFKPCGECYKMSESPPCSTDYANSTDRKKIRDDKITIAGLPTPVPAYWPVHPRLRVLGMASQMKNMALSSIPGYATAVQVRASLSSTSEMLKMLPVGSTVKQALPLLTGKAQLSNLMKDTIGNAADMLKSTLYQKSGLTQLMNMTQLLNSPADLLQALAPNLPINQVFDIINGNVDLLAAIPGANNVFQAVATLDSITNMVNRFDPEMLLDQGIGMINSQVQMLATLPNGMNLLDAQSIFKSQLDQLSKFPQNMLMDQVYKQLGTSIAIPGLGSISGSMSVGDMMSVLDGQTRAMDLFRMNTPLSGLTNQLPAGLGQLLSHAPGDISLAGAQGMITDQIAQLAGFNPNMTINDIAPSIGGAFSIPGFASISGNLSVSGALAMLQSQSGALGFINPGGTLGEFTHMLTGQMDILKGLGNIPMGEISNALRSMTGSLKGLANQLPLKDIQNMLGGGLKDLANLKNLGLDKLGDLNALYKGQLDMLNKLMPPDLQGILNGQLGDLKSLMNGQLGPLMGKLGSLQNLLGGKLNGISDAVHGAIGDVDKYIQDALGGIRDQLGPITDQITQQLGALKGLIDEKIGVVTDFIDKQVAGITNELSKYADKLADKLPLNKISDAIDKKITGPLDNELAKLEKSIPGLNKALANIDKVSEIPALAVMPPSPFQWTRTAKCVPNEFAEANSPTMEKLCEQLRAPYTPINKLKMRYHNPDDPMGITMKEGVLEGLSFKDYFWDKDNKVAHMPYPRLWDTGRSIQVADTNDQKPMDINGSYTAIVGVGREGATDIANGFVPEEQRHNDERCLYGGWGENVSVGGVNIKIPDPVTSWTELKLYQANTARVTGTVCLGRYDKAFRWRSSESMALLKSGGTFPSAIATTGCQKDAQGQTIPGSCKFSQVGIDTGAGATNDTDGMMQLIQNSNPLQWRGYMSAKDSKNRFPDLGGSGHKEKGLDNAKCGDLILLPNGGAEKDGKPGLPRVARTTCDVNYVTGSDGKVKVAPESAIRCTQENGKDSCFIAVEEADNGKWPDVCGNTDSVGAMLTRRLYKPGQLPENTAAELKRINWTGSCEDTKLQDCEMKNWGETEVYHVLDDLRDGYTAAGGTP